MTVGLPENPWPGSDGITRWKASASLPPCDVGSVSGPMIFSCSMIEPGQPWVTISGERVVMSRADVDEVNVQSPSADRCQDRCARRDRVDRPASPH